MGLPNPSRQGNIESKMRPAGNVFYLLISQLRPRQWTKNLLVFTALLFSIDTANTGMIIQSFLAFILFCFISGCVYTFNDFVDREADRQHPDKKYRPIASGALNPYLALVFSAALLTLSLGVAFYLSELFGYLLIFYVLINIAYSLKLKHIVIIDVLLIASGYVLRAIGGGIVIHVPITPWFIMCTMLLALFLGISKRRHELLLLQHNKGAHRKVLEKYSPELLNQLNSIVTTATIISYSLFTFTSGHTIYLMWSIPFVIYGIFRYLYLIHMEEKGGKPEKVVVEDKHILVTVLLFSLSVGIALYFFE